MDGGEWAVTLLLGGEPGLAQEMRENRLEQRMVVKSPRDPGRLRE